MRCLLIILKKDTEPADIVHDAKKLKKGDWEKESNENQQQTLQITGQSKMSNTLAR